MEPQEPIDSFDEPSPELESSPGADRIDLVLDIPVEISVELGRRKMLLAEVVKLGPGAVVELGKASGAPLDILANGHLIARGEAIVVGERYGVRIMNVVSPRQRLNSLTGDNAEDF